MFKFQLGNRKNIESRVQVKIFYHNSIQCEHASHISQGGNWSFSWRRICLLVGEYAFLEFAFDDRFGCHCWCPFGLHLYEICPPLERHSFFTMKVPVAMYFNTFHKITLAQGRGKKHYPISYILCQTISLPLTACRIHLDRKEIDVYENHFYYLIFPIDPI